MKRSMKVSAPLLASVAVAVMSTGCRQAEPKRCVDENNKVVDQSFCAGQPVSGNNGNNSHFAPGFVPYHYYYGGLGGYALGALATGGSNAPLAGHSYQTSTSRGGFGSSFGGGRGGEGGGEGGGHGGGSGE
jgi:hypothetical protein